MLRKISQFMKSEVHQLPPGASVHQAASLMKERRCACVVVTSGKSIEGIFTAGDLVKRVAAERLDLLKTKLAQVMTRRPETAGPGTLAIDALRMMQEGHYRHLPVIEEGRLVGIVSRRDFFGQEQDVVETEEHLTETMR
jgi:CBS domain-containing protein